MKYNEQEIIEQYIKGKNTKTIALELGTYNTTIRRILLRNNISVRNSSEAQRVVKTNPFLKPGKDYWLGLLAADGCLTSGNIVLELQEKDEYILEEYVKFIGYDVNILTNYSKRFNTRQKRVAFKNPDVYSYLIELGITPRKSKTLKINFDITYNFLRGVMDGDGYVGITNKGKGLVVSIASGSKDFIKQIAAFYDLENIRYRTYATRSNVYLIKVCAKDSILKLFNNLYKEGHVYLKRKHDKFGYIIQKWNDKNSAKTGKDTSIQSRASNQISAVTL